MEAQQAAGGHRPQLQQLPCPRHPPLASQGGRFLTDVNSKPCEDIQLASNSLRCGVIAILPQVVAEPSCTKFSLVSLTCDVKPPNLLKITHTATSETPL